MEKNIKLYPLYKMFAFNILFFGAISVIYRINVIGLSLYQISLIVSAYFLFSIILNLPISIVAEKIGLRKTMLLGNLFLLFYCVLVITLKDFKLLLFSEIFCALGFALKNSSESPFLYESLKKLGREKEYSKIESKGFFLHFLMVAITSVAAGYLYNIDVYLPLIFASSFFVIANIFCYSFEEVNVVEKKIPLKVSVGEIKAGFKFIIHSSRLRALFLFTFIFCAILNASDLLMQGYLNNIKASPTTFGYFFAIFSIVSAIGSILQKRIEKLLNKKTLSYLSIIYLSLFVVIGICLFLFKEYEILLAIGVVVFLIQAIIKGAHIVIIREYLSRYTTNSIRPKILSIYNFVRYLGSFLLMILIGYSLKMYSLKITFTFTGIFLIIIIILISFYMDSRVGKSPDLYTEKDRLDILEKISINQKAEQ